MIFRTRFGHVLGCAAVLLGARTETAQGQSVYTVQIRAAGNTVPAQRCEPGRRDSQGADSKRGTTDTLVIAVRRANGSGGVVAPVDVAVQINQKWAAMVGTSDTVAVLTGAAGSFSDDTVTIKLSGAGTDVCQAKLPTDPQAEAVDPAFTLHYGAEISSASGFSREKTSLAVGARWDVGNRTAVSTPLGRLFLSTALTSDLTQVAKLREHRSCVRETVGRPLANPIREGERISLCAKADTVGNDLFLRRERTDSIKAGVVSTWRTFLHSRTEVEDVAAGLSVGLVAGIGFQTDPGGFAQGDRRIRPLFMIGPGIRQLRADGTQRFRLDVLWGSVQSYASGDRLVEEGSERLRDTVHAFTQNALSVRDERQWQVHLDMRVFKGAHIRGFATFSPEYREPAVTGNPLNQALRSSAFPDLVRIAFLLDRDIKQLWDTLIGTAGAK